MLKGRHISLTDGLDVGQEEESKKTFSFGLNNLDGPFTEMKKKEAGTHFKRRVQEFYFRHVNLEMFIRLSDRDIDQADIDMSLK